MIYTRFGNRIKVESVDRDTGAVKYRLVDDPAEPRECHILALKADNGVKEIMEAANA